MAGETNWRMVLEQAGFGGPSFAEVALCAAVARGERAVLGAVKQGGEEFPGFALGTRPGQVTVAAGMLGTVRGKVLRALILGEVPGVEVSPQGLRVQGARISGVVDLADQGSRDQPLPPLVLLGCTGETAKAGFTLVLRDACLRGLFLPGCTLAELEGYRLHVQGETDLHAVTLLPGGAISLLRADLAGALDVSGADLAWGKDAADAWLAAPPAAGTVLDCGGAHIGADVFLRKTRAAGMLDFRGASIGGVLDAEDAVLHAPGGEALNADRVNVTGSVFLRRLKAEGALRFLGARIGGNLDLGGADLRQPEGDVLSCDRMRLGGTLFLSPDRQRSRVQGQIRLLGAEIGGSLSLIGAALTGVRGQPAVHAQNARIGGSLLAYPAADGQACAIQGGLHANGARIGDWLNLQKAALSPHPEAPDDPVLDLTHASIGNRLHIPGLGAQSRGVVDLSHATVTLLNDQDGLAWGAASQGEPQRDAAGHLTGLKLVLDGFTYQRIPDPERGDWAGREAFLKRQFEGTRPAPRDFKPQPWEQLIKTLRIQGHAEQAERFAQMKRDFAIECRAEHWLRRGWGRFVGLFFGHYYHPLRALGSAAGYALLGMLLLGVANHTGQLTKKRNDVDLTAASLGVLAPFPSYPPGAAPAQSRPPAILGAAEACWDGVSFGTLAEALGSALDMMLPVVDLHQDQRCEVTEKAGAHGLVAWLLLVYSVFGWVVSSLAVITFSGVAKKD